MRHKKIKNTPKMLILFSLAFVATFTACQNNTKDGDAVKTSYVHQYGVDIADEQEWKDRGSSGKMVQKLKDGSTVVKTWKDGTLQGLCYVTFPYTDIICHETFYENGEPLWKATNYPTGAPSQKEHYLPSECKVVAAWYQDGTPRLNEEYKDGLLQTAKYYNPQQVLETSVEQGEGEAIERDGYGQLVAKKVIKEGQVATEELFYPNGIPKQHTPYVNGVIEGTRRTFYPAGEPKTIEEWQNGKLNGIVTEFSNGELVATTPYIDGRKEGVSERFRPGTSELVEEISWKHNLRHGPSTVYVDEHTITDWYYEGQKMSKMQFIEHEHSKDISGRR